MKQAHKERGAVLVELTMMLPLLVILLVGIVDIGIVLREHQVLQNAAREGARFSALPRNWVNPTVNPTASEAAIKQRVIDYLAQENLTVTADSVTVNQNKQIVVGALTVTGSEVTVTYTSPLLIPGGKWIPIGNSITMLGQSVFRNLY